MKYHTKGLVSYKLASLISEAQLRVERILCSKYDACRSLLTLQVRTGCAQEVFM